MIMLWAAFALLSSDHGNSQKVDLKELQARRLWLYEASAERENLGYFDMGEAAPDGIFFGLGESDTLYYCSMYIDDAQPKNDRYFVTCWTRHGEQPKRLWQVKLLPGKESVKGTLLKYASEQTVQTTTYVAKADKTAQSIHHKVDGTHPDRKTQEWKLAQAVLESDMTLVHYHFNWDGDPALGNFADLHGTKGADGRNEPLEGRGDFRITNQEIALLKRLKKL
ncbi:MAG TPA: hypothetical protein VK171_17160 [Fimbriimonas sp.]|nr:hypothetical protein [Fimbriimonas sp.]